jgi:hypothetical protein
MANEPQAFAPAEFEADILDGEEFAFPKRSFGSNGSRRRFLTTDITN